MRVSRVWRQLGDQRQVKEASRITLLQTLLHRFTCVRVQSPRSPPALSPQYLFLFWIRGRGSPKFLRPNGGFDRLLRERRHRVRGRFEKAGLCQRDTRKTAILVRSRFVQSTSSLSLSNNNGVQSLSIFGSFAPREIYHFPSLLLITDY
jgi:hypothetical protein